MRGASGQLFLPQPEEERQPRQSSNAHESAAFEAPLIHNFSLWSKCRLCRGGPCRPFFAFQTNHRMIRIATGDRLRTQQGEDGERGLSPLAAQKKSALGDGFTRALFDLS